MSRPDQSITFLRSYGYCVFRVPRLSAQPLDLLHRDGKDLSRLGSVTGLIASSALPAPDVRRDDRPGVDIDGTETSKVNVNIGLNILGGFIGAVGGSTLGLQTGFNRARTVTFKYSSVTEDSIDVLALEQFISGGRIDEHVPSGTVDKLIDGEVYAITSVLKTRRIVVAAQSDAGSSVQLDVPLIQAAVGGSIKVAAQGSMGSHVAFEGPVPIPFAFQAVKLVFDDSGEFLTTEMLPAGQAVARAAVLAGQPGTGREFLTVGGAFARMAG